MKRVPVAEDTILVSCQLTLKEQQLRNLTKEEKSGEEEEKETPEQMIRSLQGVFCGGRYRSWVFTREKPLNTTSLKPLRGSRK